MVRVFDASRHPEVIKGYKTEKEIFFEFVKMWDKDDDGVITKEEFYEYFKVISFLPSNV